MDGLFRFCDKYYFTDTLLRIVVNFRQSGLKQICRNWRNIQGQKKTRSLTVAWTWWTIKKYPENRESLWCYMSCVILGKINHYYYHYYCHHWWHRTTAGATIDDYHDDVITWKRFSRYWAFVRGIHRCPVNFPHKGQWRGALMFSLICVWINGWVNNREAGDLRRYHAHFDVTVMIWHRNDSQFSV